MANLWVKRIGRQISLVFFTAILVVAWGMPSLAQLPFLPSPNQSSAPESHPWDLNQAFPCGKVWCSNVYLLKSDTWLKTAFEERTILTPELTVTAIGDPSDPPQEIAQQAEQRAELVQRIFSQTVKQVLDRSTLSTVPYQTDLSFWLPLSLQGLDLPIMVKPLHPWTPRVEIGNKNQQTVIFLPAQPSLGLASQVLVTLTAVDAKANGKTIEQLAELWRVNIQLSFSNALWGFELDRQHPFLRWKLAGAILGATLLLILVIETIRGLLRKWNHHLRHNLGILNDSLAIDPEALTGKKKDISSEQSKDGARTSSAANPSQHQGATKLFWGLSPLPLELGQNHHPRWILLIWRMIHWNLNQLLGLIANLYNLLKRISHKSKWLSPRFYISKQKQFLRKQTAIKQQRNFCSLLLAQMLITEILIFAVGLSMIFYIFRETRVLADVLFEKSIFLIAIWIALIFIDKVGAFLIDNYLNHWASEAQTNNPNSNRYTLRASTYSSTLKQATTFVVILLGIYITMVSMGVNPGVLAGAGIFAVAIAFLPVAWWRICSMAF